MNRSTKKSKLYVHSTPTLRSETSPLATAGAQFQNTHVHKSAASPLGAGGGMSKNTHSKKPNQ